MGQVIQAAAHLALPIPEIYLYRCENLAFYI